MTEIDELLKTKFGFDKFRPGQAEILSDLQAGKNVLGVLPTGAGKSLIYQLYGYLVKQTVVIVSPLISLMEDQVSRMNYLGEKRVTALNSTQSWKEQQQILQHLDDYRYLFVSPEMLSNQKVINRFRQLKLGLFVIDEAHCVSKWGLDFRPEYLNLHKVLSELGNPQTLMMTATASKKVQDDLIGKLGVRDVSRVIENVNRPNIYLSVQQFGNEKKKREKLFELLKQLRMPGIIYFSSKKKADEVAEMVSDELHLNAAAYHAGLSSEDRFHVQHQFMNGDLEVVCATSAFGMGIDKSDIRFVIHYHLSQDMESYVQEIGRAGRDLRESVSILLFTKSDFKLAQSLISNGLPTQTEVEDFYKNAKQSHLEDQKRRLLSFYKSHQYSDEQVAEIFKNVTENKRANLRQVLHFINLKDTCRRHFLLGIFDQDFNGHTEKCCDYGTEVLPLQKLGLLAPDKKDDDNRRQNWRQILTKLFTNED